MSAGLVQAEVALPETCSLPLGQRQIGRVRSASPSALRVALAVMLPGNVALTCPVDDAFAAE